MREGNIKKNKLSWSRRIVRKMFNIKGETVDFQADDHFNEGVEMERRSNFSEREPRTIKKSKTAKARKNSEPRDRRRMNFDHPRIIKVQNYSVFVATWNVAGRSPPGNLSLDDFLHAAAPADIYVLGFQEIVPLNAGNILGAEDSGPAKKWIALVRKTLNNLPGTSECGGCYTPSPIPQPVVEMHADFEGSLRRRNSSFSTRRSFQTINSWADSDPSIQQPRLDRRFSVCDRAMFGHRPSDYDSSYRWGNQLSDYSRKSDCSRSSNYSRQSECDSSYRWGHWPSDYTRPSDYSRASNSLRPSNCSRGVANDDDDDDGGGGTDDSPSTVTYSPMSYNGATCDQGYRMTVNSGYCLVAGKQMVGIFLTVWVRSELRDYVKNMKVSCVGRGLMGYLGNKGSIAISMLVHDTSFCFICSHLTSGEKEGDELRRNSDVMEILKKTKFPQVHGAADDKSPQTILEHDRIIWLGDLNYRISLSYRSASALVEMQNWRGLLEKDQLRMEQKRGRVFVGWNEGKIYFAPTYKYSTNSDRYSGGDMHPKEKRRTPAWCDRILWLGEGLQQVSYVRGESRFSDHRPVYGIFYAEVETTHCFSKKSSTYASSRVAAEELLPYTDGYTELSFF